MFNQCIVVISIARVGEHEVFICETNFDWASVDVTECLWQVSNIHWMAREYVYYFGFGFI